MADRGKLEQIPNSVSGDGKTFVAQLKKFLQSFRDDTEKRIDGIGAGAVAQVFDLELSETHSYDSKGNPINNIFVEFDNTNVSNYLNAQIWMKKSTETAYYMVGTTSNVTFTIPDVTAGVTYYVKVVACNTNSGTSDFANAPYDDITIQGSVLVPAAPTQFYLTFDSEGALWEWQFTDNGYVDFFELRLDGLAGTWNANRLDSTRNNFSRAEPPVRSGTAYLFIRNIYGTYSQPATHIFNVSAPAKPTNAPTLEMTLNGVVITMDALPQRCISYEVEITDSNNNVDVYETANSQFVYYQFSGSISVRYRFLDQAGHGEWSNATSGNMKSVLNLVELPEISYSKFDAATQAAIDQATTALEAVDELGDQLLEILTAQGEGTSTEFALLQSQVNANAGNISTIIANLTVSPDGSNSYTAINQLKQTANSLSSTISTHTTNISTINSNISNITQNATSLSSTVQTLSNSVATNASNISQTSTSLSAVVTALETSDPSQVNSRWAAITALADGIDLCVKDTDLDGEEIVSRINIQSGVTTIDGKYLHVTGDTVFDGSVIVGGSIADGAVTEAKIGNSAITSAKIGSGAVTEAKLGSGAVTSAKISSSAVTAEKIDSGAVTEAKIGTGAVTTDKIGDSAVATAKIVDGAISSVKIGDGAVIADKIASNAVTSNKIYANAVTAAKIASNAVTTDKINASAITTAKLAANAVTAAKIAANTITSDQIATGGIIADNIASNAVTSAKIYAGAITTAKLAADAVTTDKIKAGAVTADEIASSAITTAKLNASAVTAAKIASSAVTADKIYAGAVTSEKIAAGAVITEKLAAGAITANEIASNAITTAKLNANAVTAAKIASSAITAEKISTNAVTSAKIAAGAVTAAKISVNNLQAVSANVGNLTGGTLTGTELIGTSIRNSNSTFTVSANGAIKGATLTAGTIEASMISNAGYTVRSSVIGSGTVSGNNGQIPLPSGYTEAQCLWTAYPPKPPSVTGYVPNPTVQYSMSGRKVTCLAIYSPSGDEGTDLERYLDVPYRIIGIK